MSSGKFYCEFLCQDADSVIGIAKGNHVIANDKYVGQDPGGYSYNGQNGQKLNNSSGSSYGSSYTAGDLIGIAFDADNGTLRFYKNNINQGQAFSDLTDEYYFAFSIRDTGYTHSVNFGQKPFKFPPPAGFQPLNDANTRPVKVISRPDQYVGVTTYSGDDSNPRSISTSNAPDFVWIKCRSNNSTSHVLSNSINEGSHMASNSAASESTGLIKSIDSTGFSLESVNGRVNEDGRTYVAWTWRAGGNKNTFNKDDVGYASAAAAGLDGGTINPTGASVGTRQGFSIIKYTGNQTDGATVPHGLGKIPHLIIVKSLSDSTYEWGTLHLTPGTSTGFSGGNLNSSDTVLDLSNASRRAQSWHAAPTSSVFSLGADGSSYTGTYNNNQEYIAYVWCDVPGLQKFGTYEGNGDSGGDGPFVELGFRPVLVWFKATTGTQPWNVFNSEIGKINPIDEGLLLNTADDEFTGSARVDYLSNGFKVRYPGAGNPNVATTYVYCAWAEAPTINLYGGQSNAR